MRREDWYSALLGICGAERHGAITALDKGLTGDYVPDLGVEDIHRDAFLLPDLVTG